MSKILPKDLTSYDLLKTLAVLLMVVDHIGMYFFPDHLWWRVFGRLSAPIWLFLIGYARSRDVPAKLWGGALILAASSVFISPHLLPLTILFGMMFVRPVLDRAANHIFSGFEPMMFALVFISLFMLPSHFLVEYGLLCLLVPLYGYMRRNPETLTEVSALRRGGFIVFTFASYVVMSALGCEFTVVQNAVMFGGVGAVFALLYFFEAKTFSVFSNRIPKPAVALLQFGGRRTLEIYVAHVLLFKALAFVLGVEGFGLFEWTWF